MRICKDCKLEQPKSNFYKRGKTSLQTFCKRCNTIRFKEYRLKVGMKPFEKNIFEKNGIVFRNCNVCRIDKNITQFRKQSAQCKSCKADIRRKTKGAMTTIQLQEFRKKKKGIAEHIYNICVKNKKKIINRLNGYIPIDKKISTIKKYIQDKTRRIRSTGYTTLWARENRLKARAFYHKRHSCINAENDFSVTDLSIRMLIEQQENKCIYCKTELDHFHLDHIQPLSRGGRHTIGNLQILCQFCNLSKGAKNHEEFIYFLNNNNRVYNT